ncbi:AT-hook motif nuclear-localized protein 9 [Hibiscus syriacus]|uniref:AT-hook motif nuclear-localized protein n=1 Tax=Hibiscus syriacus TaxID=106335 RepID=A0A6A3CFL9_HIBSY|nr:AT-hook motif nuclear-localized protein 9-like [Hibiscus syriacus]KAE8727526.1 AT-hook motif nuclear-localized protein 9 [Hibiscus syriacus]
MDRRDVMALSGSASYYMQQRGISGSGSEMESGMHGSQGIHPLSNPNVQYLSSIRPPTIESTLPLESPSGVTPHSVNVDTRSAVPPSEAVKRKRGRPRKYGPDGTVSLALTPASATRPATITPGQKRGRGRPPGTGRKQQLASLGEWLSGSAGMGFTPHVITVAIGEDVAAKILSFSQQGRRAVCILSANGAVSTVTLLQPSSSGGSVTYEGRFEILCLSGSYLLTGNSGSCNRTGCLSVSLATPDGRVIGGAVGGTLIAASPVQVIVGSFVWGGAKTKNKKPEGQECLNDSDNQSADNLVSPSGILPSQNLIPTSPVAVWPGSRTMDMRDTHVNIDLMRG